MCVDWSFHRSRATSIMILLLLLTERQQDTKAKQMQRKINSAKSLCSLSEHASMYIPLTFPTSPSSSLPKFIRRQVFDRESSWHTSALLATVIESISLPSRLYQFGGSGSRACYLNSIEAVLNGNGNQKISSVQMSIADPAKLHAREEKVILNLGVRGGNIDDRLRMQDRSIKEGDCSATNSHAAKLDINFLPSWNNELPLRASHPYRGHSSRQSDRYEHEKNREHIFGQVETMRGLDMGGIGGHNEADQQEASDDNRTNRMQRKLAALPILEMYVLFLTIIPYLTPPSPLPTSRSFQYRLSPLSVCILPAVYLSVLVQVTVRWDGICAHIYTSDHPPCPYPPPGRGSSLATKFTTKWIGKKWPNSALHSLRCSSHANAMQASVSLYLHYRTLIFFAASITCAAFSLGTHTLNPPTHIISSIDTAPLSSSHSCPPSLWRFSSLRRTIITTSPFIPPYPPAQSFPPRSKV